MCGGTLVASKYIISASHCFHDLCCGKEKVKESNINVRNQAGQPHSAWASKAPLDARVGFLWYKIAGASNTMNLSTNES